MFNKTTTSINCFSKISIVAGTTKEVYIIAIRVSLYTIKTISIIDIKFIYYINIIRITKMRATKLPVFSTWSMTCFASNTLFLECPKLLSIYPATFISRTGCMASEATVVIFFVNIICVIISPTMFFSTIEVELVMTFTWIN